MSTSMLAENAFLIGDQPEQFTVYTERHMDRIAPLQRLPEASRFAMRVVASVLPFRVNQYVIDQLIDWDNVPEDPMFQLTFPQPGMLTGSQFDRVADAMRRELPRDQLKQVINNVRAELNPHPAGQQQLNVPRLNGQPLPGMQHKYNETVLFFPSQGQTCHSYCSFCFRWAQFIGDKELRFSSSEADSLLQYLLAHREVSDVLITGGDPMVMKADKLAEYLEVLCDPRLEHIKTIRIGTKSLTFWPQRYVNDADADVILRAFEKVVNSGRQLALMAHYNHWREMDTPIAAEAIQRIRSTGAVIRSQGPLLAHINDNAADWARLWTMQVNQGVIPYYMFVERDTGAKHYFEVPLHRAWKIYRDAMKQVTGLARTARGPSMSAGPGKVEIQGVAESQGEKVFVCRFIQARNEDWVQRPFFAKYDEQATWLDQLQPAFGEQDFFFSQEYRDMCDQALIG